MARRVNTRFVVILSAALMGAACLAGGAWIYRGIRERNPDLAKTRGETFEKAGDLKNAVLQFKRAASILSQSHQSGADAVYAHTADLCMKISRDAQTQEDAVRYFQAAMQCYGAALQENPRNTVVNETLMEESYLNAQYFPNVLDYWKSLEEVATKLIASHDYVKPRLYRAEARMYRTAVSIGNVSNTALADIAADLDKAQTFDPRSNKAIVLRAQFTWLQAQVNALRRRLTTADQLNQDESFQRAVAAVRQMLINRLEGNWDDTPAMGWSWFTRIPQTNVDAEVAAALASISIDQYRLSGGKDRSRLDVAVALLEVALAADPAKTDLVATLGSLYMTTGNADKAEDLYQKTIKRAPEQPEGYFRLASFYRERGETSKAIDGYTEVLRHPMIGIGRDAVRNESYQWQAWEGIAWLNMDLAERQGATSEEIQLRLKNAADATDKLRVSHVQNTAGVVNLLEGRMLLINRDFPRAMATLRTAEANLNAAPGMLDRYRRTELMLARANEQQNQLGAALDLINKALAIRPDDAAVLISQGQLLLNLGRFDQARIVMEHVLANESSLPPALADAARRIWVAAGAPKNPTVPDSIRGTLPAALINFNNENYADAASDAEDFLAKPDNSSDDTLRAYQVAIACNVRLQQVDKAKVLVAQALQKFPANASFQMQKIQLDDPEGAKTPAGQKKIIEAITDDDVRSLTLASFYQQQKEWDNAIAVLQKMRDANHAPSTAAERERLNSILDRLFTAAAVAAGNVPDAKKDDYWKLAQSFVTELEKLNLDGTDGKLYRGRLELARTNGKSGLQFLQQAVAQRPDYANGHLTLAMAFYNLADMSAAGNSSVTASYRTSALDEFRQVLRLAPNNLVAIEHAIDLLWIKGDSAGLTEAQSLLEAGLALAPRNRQLILLQELLLPNVDAAITSREAILKSNPDDRANLYRLSALYVKKKDGEANPDQKQRDMERAVALIESDFQRHPDELAAGDQLARKLVDYDKSDKGATRAIDIYDHFIANPDPAIRFNALVAKAEFLRTLQLRTDAIQALKAAKKIAHDDVREEAVEAFKQAIAAEPAGQDDADRHLADTYFDIGRMADAETLYLQILQKNLTPSAAEPVARRLIEAQLRQNKFEEALPRLDAFLKAQPADIQGLTLRAYAHIQQGLGKSLDDQQKALKAALTDLNAVLAIDSDNAEALLYRARAQMTFSDRLDDAEKDLQQAARQKRTALSAQSLLIELYLRTQRYEEASRGYREILRQNPDLIAVRIEYVRVLKSLAELQLTLPPDSDVTFVVSLKRLDPLNRYMDEVNTASDKYPNDPRWWLFKAQGFVLQNKNTDALTWFKAIYDQLLKQKVIDPDVCDAYLGSLLRANNFDETIAISSNLIDTNADFIAKNPQYVSFFLKRAAAYQGLKKSAEAVKDIDRGLAVGVKAATETDNFGPFIAVLNEAAVPLSQTASAQPASSLSPELIAERLRARITANPEETISKIGLIQNLLIMNQPAEALKVVETLNTSEKNATLRALVLRQSALVHGLNKLYPAAEKDYKDLEVVMPNNVENMNNYAFMLADGMKRPKDAIPYAKRALQLLSTRAEPTTVAANAANIYDTLGWAYCLSNDLVNAESNLRNSVKVQPQPAAYLHLAVTLQKANKKDEALQNCLEGIKMAAARRDTETLAMLKDLQTQLAP